MFSHEALETAYVFTCYEVLYYGAPILYIAHTNDGNWLYLCGKEHEGEDAPCVLLQTMYRLDPSISQVADLPLGKQARRATARDPWEII